MTVYNYPAVEAEPSLPEAAAKYLDEHLEYSFVCVGSGGPQIYFQLGRHGHKYNSFETSWLALGQTFLKSC